MVDAAGSSESTQDIVGHCPAVSEPHAQLNLAAPPRPGAVTYTFHITSWICAYLRLGVKVTLPLVLAAHSWSKPGGYKFQIKAGSRKKT